MSGEVRTWYDTNSAAGTFTSTIRAAGGEQVRVVYITGNAGYQGNFRWVGMEQADYNQLGHDAPNPANNVPDIVLGPSTNEGVVLKTNGNDGAVQRRGLRGVKIN